MSVSNTAFKKLKAISSNTANDMVKAIENLKGINVIESTMLCSSMTMASLICAYAATTKKPREQVIKMVFDDVQLFINTSNLTDIKDKH